jgi:TM2 domain-containing membrane protein YozV
MSLGYGGAQPPGWYPEPGSGYLRWWDGASWGPYQQAQCPTCAQPVAPGQVACGTCGQPMPALGGPPGGAPKDKTVAGILGILLGGFGAHKFYLGRTTSGTLMLAGSIFGVCCGSFLIIPLLFPMVFGVIGLIEGILYLTKSDQEFQQTYVYGEKDWF